ncbi:MAG: acyl CoA:acetate/3-ketoacid CoA transferase [Actinobacteria bacterium]|nr:acyl CoA:acetate/3-ketoacid CoA transferase [Actinomycetota bacterium]
MTPTRILSPADAVALIAPGQTVAVGGTGHMLQVPDGLLAALEERHAATGEPSGLTVVHTMGLGDNAGAGLDRLAAPGLVGKLIGSHYGHNEALTAAIVENRVQAFSIPGGVLSQLYREIAGGRPGLITRVGLGTFADPRIDGGRLNDAAEGSISEVVEFDGREWLRYPSFPIDVAILRATTADPDGNLTMEDEAGISDNLAIASAAHNSGGLVIAEVKRLATRGSLSPRRVRVPGILVDVVVEVPEQRQTGATRYSPYLAGLLRAPDTALRPLDHGIRKLIARRAADELRAGDVVNLGFGIATGVAAVLQEEGAYDRVVFSIEQGIIGGVPGSGLDSGTAANAQAFIDPSAQFDLYDGGGLDVCCVSFGEMDRAGNVNVSSLGGKPVGPGGFINISQNSRKVVLCGTFTGGGLAAAVTPDGLRIEREGRYRKFVDAVSHTTLATSRIAPDVPITCITERAVFRLTRDGIELAEVAPGIDPERDVLALMDFAPIVKGDPVPMDLRLFAAGRVGLPYLD